ncbi:MAG: hypothetical protein GTO17_10775 [Candidatus Aminicenantes bacterium]|nr:hypothetical protein [Candidatus Aminicenantes bacterium]
MRYSPRVSGRKKKSIGKIGLVSCLVIAAVLFLSSLFDAQSPGYDKFIFLDFEELPFASDMGKFTATFGAVFSDINNDGWDDLIVSNHGWMSPSVYLNHFGQFVDYSHVLPVVWEKLDRHGITVVDIDNDRDKDVLIAAGGAEGRGPGAKNHLYLNLLTETGQFDFRDITESTNLELRSMRSRSFLPLASRDGRRVDFYLTALVLPDTTNIYLRNKSSPSRVEFVPDASFNLNESWKSHGRGLFFDYERDGDQDFIEIKGDKAFLLIRDQGKYQQVQSELSSVSLVTCAALGDLNNDGFLDVVLGTRPPRSYSDHFSFNSEKVGIAFTSVDPNNSQSKSDVDGIEVSSDADQVDIYFWVKPGITPDNPSDIYLGEAKANPPSRIATISADQARGRPNMNKKGTYIWHDPQESSWYLRCKFEQPFNDFQGELTFSEVDDVIPFQLEIHKRGKSQDKIFINLEGNDFLELDVRALEHVQFTRSLVIFDFNNDGWQDVIGIRGTEEGDYNGDPIILINKSNLNFKKQLNNPFSNPEDDIYQAGMLIAGFVNDDGLPDIFMTNGYGLIPGNKGPYKLFINKTHGDQNFVIIELEGKDSNKDAIGAQVELLDDEDNIIGYNELGAGYNRVQSTHKLHFGLGNYSGKISARIRWPKGNIVTREVTANVLNIIRED